MATTEQLIELVFWYPPPVMTPDSIISLGTDQYGMVNADIQENILESQTINLTPQAYTSWYEANLSSISVSKNYTLLSSFYTKMTSPIGNYNNYADYATALVAGYGLEWIPYSQWYGTGGLVFSITKYFPGIIGFETNIFVGLYKLYPYYVHALVQPAAPTQTNIVGNLASNIPWYVYAILGIAGILLLISWMQKGGIFAAAQTIESTRKTRAERKEGERRERREEERREEEKGKEVK